MDNFVIALVVFVIVAGIEAAIDFVLPYFLSKKLGQIGLGISIGIFCVSVGTRIMEVFNGTLASFVDETAWWGVAALVVAVVDLGLWALGMYLGYKKH